MFALPVKNDNFPYNSSWVNSIVKKLNRARRYSLSLHPKKIQKI